MQQLRFFPGQSLQVRSDQSLLCVSMLQPSLVKFRRRSSGCALLRNREKPPNPSFWGCLGSPDSLGWGRGVTAPGTTRGAGFVLISRPAQKCFEVPFWSFPAESPSLASQYDKNPPPLQGSRFLPSQKSAELPTPTPASLSLWRPPPSQPIPLLSPPAPRDPPTGRREAAPGA